MPSARRVGPGLRGRVMLTFAFGAALVSLALAISVFTVCRGYLVDQRERSAERQAGADADLLGSRLDSAGAYPARVLATLDPPVDSVLLLSWRDEWFSSEPAVGPDDLPGELTDAVTGGTDTGGTDTVSVTVRGDPYFAVAVPLPGVTGEDAWLVELAPVRELQSTLRVLGGVLVSCGVLATLAAAAVGLWASRRVLRPLDTLAGTAAEIASGELATRLPESHDRDLITLVVSFNTMVDSLQRRIERERRFFADVSHELRSPLTTLVTSVEVMRRHDEDLPERSRLALGLVTGELGHLRRLLDDLLALARTEAGIAQDAPQPIALPELLTHAVTGSGRDPGLLSVAGDMRNGVIGGRKLALERAFVNLMDNADRHGGGLTGVTVRGAGRAVEVLVDDAGAGVPAEDRERIFERFATRSGARGAAGGTGLGLALVRETVVQHGGTVECTDSPAGGARFVVRLPLADPP
ncbi:HAMP domain-containing sensor histidine kinase [Actinophytocola gossypii]|uniref:histidine kinase n=1 Tax=Actinophytocola gossypii TaxID=2812003 RepID=A0ABT2J965_9PSEU|nr:HAMP domain-containing sensor histidine kinase [Actinophytocola gossypii]MCT2584405.1 HAMP domain-containing histidine kinase [Actinophytocola gossypii]